MSGAASRLRLVLGSASWRNVGSGRSKATSDAVGLLLLQEVDEHRREPEHRVGDLARRRGHVGGQREERAVGQRVAVESRSSFARAQRAGRGTRSATSRMPRSLAHRGSLDEREGFAFLHPTFVDQQTLGSIDDLARLQLLAQGIDLAGEVLHLAEAPDGYFDRGDQIALLIRLDEIRQRTGVACLFDHLALAERGQHQHTADPFCGDRASRLEAIDARHLDVEDRQIRSQLAHQGDRLVATTGLANDVVTLFLEGLTQVEANDRLILGDHNTNRHWRQSLRWCRSVAAFRVGEVRRATGPVASPGCRSRR